MGAFVQGGYRKRFLKALDAQCEDSLAGNAAKHSVSEPVPESQSLQAGICCRTLGSMSYSAWIVTRVKKKCLQSRSQILDGYYHPWKVLVFLH